MTAHPPSAPPYFGSWLRLWSLTCVSSMIICSGSCCTSEAGFTVRINIGLFCYRYCNSPSVLLIRMIPFCFLNFLITVLCTAPLLIIILCNYLQWICFLVYSHTHTGRLSLLAVFCSQGGWALLQQYVLNSQCTTAPLWTAVKHDERPHFTPQP